jgi:2-polyprenyl-3-methyl-5-hydroxy-6-metoxy-1,4-benzoquinol methylase
MPDDWRVHALHAEQLRRLEEVGLRRGQRVLDYGCGSGAFLRHLRQNGYDGAAGYDEYSGPFGDRSVLASRYACVLCQDVIEHVAHPLTLIDQLARHTEPGGIVAIGTPNAEAIDLRYPGEYRHALHLPFHRHILSRTALIHAAERRGLRLERYYPTQYANTRMPFLNSAF